jgi:hypothetical protein
MREVVRCVSVWHPVLGYGGGVPILYKDATAVQEALKKAELWPLVNGWIIVPIRVHRGKIKP